MTNIKVAPKEKKNAQTAAIPTDLNQGIYFFKSTKNNNSHNNGN